METNIFYGSEHVFTNRTADSDITLLAGSGETLSSDNVIITDATVASLNISYSQNMNLTNSTIYNMLATNSTISGLSTTNYQNTNSSITRSTNLNLICTNFSSSSLITTASIITSSTIGSLFASTQNITYGFIDNIYSNTADIATKGTITKLNLTTGTTSSLIVSNLYPNCRMVLNQPCIYFNGGTTLTLSVASAKLTLDGDFWNNRSAQNGCTFATNGYFTVPFSDIYAIDVQIALTSNGLLTRDAELGILYNNKASKDVFTIKSSSQLSGIFSLELNTFLYLETGINYCFYITDSNASGATTFYDTLINRGSIILLT